MRLLCTLLVQSRSHVLEHLMSNCVVALWRAITCMRYRQVNPET